MTKIRIKNAGFSFTKTPEWLVKGEGDLAFISAKNFVSDGLGSWDVNARYKVYLKTSTAFSSANTVNFQVQNGTQTSGATKITETLNLSNVELSNGYETELENLISVASGARLRAYIDDAPNDLVIHYIVYKHS